jgi:heptosyltransferase-3
MPVLQPTNIQPKRILVITLRYLGDTLLVTPLISSLKQAYPAAEIDVLLPGSNVGMLDGNPDINKLIPMPGKPSLLSFGILLYELFRRYDLSISTQAGDRPVLCAVLSGKISMGFVSGGGMKSAWKRLLLDSALEFDGQHSHAVLENLRFCRPLNIAPCYRLTPPRAPCKNTSFLPAGKYAVLHVMPQWRYKWWHSEGWVKVADYLNQMGCQIVLTGSSQAEEQEALRTLQRKLPSSTCNLAGNLSLSQLTALIENAVLFIGPDTGITHLAAATGISTIAIFGPTDPKKWAPWPVGYASNEAPFVSIGSQRVNNVYLLQGVAAQGCVPCQLEGCDRNRQSYSACLDSLSSEVVIEAINQLL